MCGIAGALGRTLPTVRVLDALGHRGPDDRGELTVGELQLLHTRLSIIDRVGGVQPMRRGALSVAYNGEIYNHLALRELHGLDCATASDTETLLALFERRGIDCLDELDGMFAFALHDASSGALWLARDRAGEKPLYVWTGPGEDGKGTSLAFASELNALAAALPLEVDDAAVNAFLSTGVFFGAETPYHGVLELEPGCRMRVDVATGERRVDRWYSQADVAAGRAPIENQDEALACLEDALAGAVRRSLLTADVEVGAFLSGGLDSGLVCALAAREVESLRTFTVAFDGLFDESPLAASVAARHGTRHEVLEVDFERLPDDIDGIVGNYGEPVCDDSIVPTWYVSRAAREHVKVVLTGDGADELFGGYRRYVPYAHVPLFGGSGEGQSVLGALASRLPPPRTKQGGYNYAWRLAALLSARGLDRYVASTTTVDGSILAAPLPSAAMRAAHADLAEGPESSLSKLMMMDFRALLGGAYLPKMDIGSMAHSLEARSPFLGREVLECAARLPDRMKIRGRTTKWLLRELAARHLPETVRTAPKRGFETPLVDWVDGRLREAIGDRLAPSGAWVRRFCRDGAVEALLDGRSAHPPQQRARLLWTLFCTETWYARSRRGAR